MSVRGVKTNIPFLLNVLNHSLFRNGECNTGFIDNFPELFDIQAGSDEELKIMNFIGNKVVNETKGIKPNFNVPSYPKVSKAEIAGLKGTKQLFDEKGPKALADWVLKQEKLLITDTTMRDAQQSLMATRVRSIDMEKIAPAVAKYGHNLFSLEMWGGATFDTAFRFLKEDPPPEPRPRRT